MVETGGSRKGNRLGSSMTKFGVSKKTNKAKASVKDSASDVSKAMTDILKSSLLRHDDISMLRQLLRSLHLKNVQQNAADGSG